jgi:serine phosphatase RsbU (regulator of sigma subunit)
MRDPFRTRGFERRLLVFFLLLSVTPTILIAIFGARYFLGPVERVSSPALRESFSNSMEIARQLSTQLEQDAHAASRRIAEDYIRSGFPKDPRAVNGFLEAVTKKTQADFGAIYVKAGNTWRLTASYPHKVDRIDETIDVTTVPDETGPQIVAFSDQDIIASGILHGPDTLFIAGLVLDVGMTDMMRKTGQDVSLYGSVGQWVRSMRLYIIIIFGAIVVVTAISSAVVSRVLAGRISHPIKELAVATDRIARGDLEHRVNVKAKDEIQSLVSSFNNMTQELEENKRNLIAMARREAQVARDYEIARQVQQKLFPEELPAETGWEFAATCRPARAVGGDYYDIFEVAPGMVLFSQGDVSGKGLGASLVMASVHAIIRSWAITLKYDLMKLIKELNQYLIDSSAPETFVTLFLGLLDCADGRISYLNCGHPPVLVHCCSDGRVDELSIGGTILGILPSDTFELGEYSLADGDSLVLVSDGVTEATNPGDEMFEMERLLATVRNSGCDVTAKETMTGIIRAVDAFAEGCEQADDISVLVLRKNQKMTSQRSADAPTPETKPTGE